MSEVILGVSAFYHDSAAAIIIDGEIIAAAQEERFTRKKHDPSFPVHAIKYCIHEADISGNDLTYVVFYDKPFIKFERLLETYHSFVPFGYLSFLRAMPVWIKEKLFMRRLVRKELNKIGIISKIPVLFTEHHLAHAASAFFPSPYDESAILTIDGVGEWTTSAIGYGIGQKIKILKELHFPHSIGLLYSSFTYYCGFRVNSGEYKLMGLAPYGIKNSPRVENYKKIIKEKLVDIRHDGSILLNMKYFNFASGDTMTKDNGWEKLFNLKRRSEEQELTQPYMDLALAIQEITNEIVLKLAITAKELTNSENLVLAGGVALNCVSNSFLLKSNIFKNIWIQPAAGDAGGALGSALAVWYIYLNRARQAKPIDSMEGSYLGPGFSNNKIRRLLDKLSITYLFYNDYESLANIVAQLISQGNVIGWFQGRMEFGPRALGNRSILGDPRNPDMQKRMNLKIKFRESFRPFAPAVLEEEIDSYFEDAVISKFMLHVFQVKDTLCYKQPVISSDKDLFERLYFKRSDLPAITHIDNTARVQSVNRATNDRFWLLLKKFKSVSGYGVLINTSFNVRGEPIVCSPLDAIRCFVNTEIDYLVLGDFLLNRSDLERCTNNFSAQYTFERD